MTEADFDRIVDRTASASEKVDGPLRDGFGDDFIALSIAELDFETPSCVKDAMKRRVEHGVFGYSMAEEGLSEALSTWMQRRRGWSVEPSKLLWSPGTVTALIAAIEALTDPGDAIVVMSPIYPPFLHIVETTGRRLVTSAMHLGDDGAYRMDMEDVERCVADGAKMVLFCNPHNPTGRVWSAEELREMGAICARYACILVSDEVHADIVYPGASYSPTAAHVPDELRLITALSSGKTFSLTGLNLSAAVCSHPRDRERLARYLRTHHLNPYHPLSMPAFKAAWQHGDGWVDALVDYLDGNRRVVFDALSSVEGVQPIWPQSTFVMWVDCRGLHKDDAELSRFFADELGIGVSAGVAYGDGGSGFVRLNFGTRRAVLHTAVERLRTACTKGD